MKVTIEVECTPEEARRAMGLPDMSALHEAYAARVKEAMATQPVGPEALGNLVKQFAAGDAGADFLRSLFAGGSAKPRGS